MSKRMLSFRFIHFLWIYASMISLLVLATWSYRYRIQPYREKKRLKQWLTHQPLLDKYLSIAPIFNTLYAAIDTQRISHRERRRLNLNTEDFVYGEVVLLSFFILLHTLNPTTNDVFYDLGCGAGKAVFIAALACNLKKACGIELLPGLVKLAQQQRQQLSHLLKPSSICPYHLPQLTQRIHFIQGNILEQDISDATLVFINATCFDYWMWEKIITRLMLLRPGTRILVTTKKLPPSVFKLLFSGRYLMSWGLNSVNAYMKIA